MMATDAFRDAAIDDMLISAQMMLDPYPVYERLRNQFPVFRSEAWQAWIVSRYDDVSATLHDNENLSNERRQETLFAGLGTSQRDQLARLRHYFAEKDVIGSDPPDHNRIRRLVARAFTPRTIAGLQPRITEVAAELLTQALGPGQPFDFVAAISHPLPVIVIAEVLGVPVADRPLFKKWSADILGFQGTGTTTGEVLSGPGQPHRAVRLYEHAHRRPQTHPTQRRHHRACPRRGGQSAAHPRRAAGFLQHTADRRA